MHSRSVDAAHLLGRIHSLESLGTVDGPGTRFVVFMQGCMLRCAYCHNRDTWNADGGRLFSVSKMITEIMSYSSFLDHGGGVTISGGEPLMQLEFVRVLFNILHCEGIHTCIDTNGYLSSNQYDYRLDDMLKYTNLVLLDLKHIDEQKHIELTGVSNSYVLKFARHLDQLSKPTWIRHVVVPGYTDDLEDVKELARFVSTLKNVERVELLPYHKLGVHKWEQFESSYPLLDVEPPTSRKMAEILAIFQSFDLDVCV